MRIAFFAALLLSMTAAAAQTQEKALPPISGVETVYSDAELERDRSIARQAIEGILDPVEAMENQYARWKRPVCFNVYGLAPAAKYVVERRMKDIAQQVGAPVDRAVPCIPSVTIAFTPDPAATLDSIASVRPTLLPYYGFIRSELKESLPIQAWYGITVRGPTGLEHLEYDAQNGGMNDAIAPPSFSFMSGEMSRLNSGLTTAIASVVIVVNTNAIMGKSLGTLADHFAMLALAQARVTRGCKDMPTIANLMYANCDATHRTDAITNTDLALLTGLYSTPDNVSQRIQKARVIGTMRRTLEAQATGK